jgi:hypothetical protein
MAISAASGTPGDKLMTSLEFIVVFAASPIVAALVYGSWKFSSDEEVDTRPPRNRPAKWAGIATSKGL